MKSLRSLKLDENIRCSGTRVFICFTSDLAGICRRKVEELTAIINDDLLQST